MTAKWDATLFTGHSAILLVHGEIAALLAVCDDAPPGTRDAAIISILYGCGLRRSAVVELDLAGYDANATALLVRGKGNKQRRVPLGRTAPAVDDWPAVRGTGPGPLFHGFGNRNRGSR